jgi:hypothetical protein
MQDIFEVTQHSVMFTYEKFHQAKVQGKVQLRSAKTASLVGHPRTVRLINPFEMKSVGEVYFER